MEPVAAMKRPNSHIPRPRTLAEYVDLVDQAIFEIEELRAAAEYDMDSLGDAVHGINDLERQVRQLRLSLSNGSHRFGGEDLLFMALVERQDDRVLPFKYLFRMINETHREGLAVEDT